MLVSALLLAVQIDSSAYLRTHREADRALVAGRAAEARAAFEKCLELAPKNPTAAYGLACAHAKAGEREAALHALGQAVEWGYTESELALWDQDLASLRGEEAFQRAIDSMREVEAARPDPVIATIVDAQARSPIDVAIDRNGTWVAVGYDDGLIALLDAGSGLDLSVSRDLESPVWALDVRPDGKTLAVLTRDGKLHFWSPESSQAPTSVVALRPTEEDYGFPFGGLVEFDPSGERVLAGGSDRGAMLCSAAGRVLRDLDGKFGDDFDARLAWSVDGKAFASWNASEVTFFDGETGEPTGMSLVAPSEVFGFAYSPRGDTVATGHDGRILLWVSRTSDGSAFELLRELVAPDVFFIPPIETRELAFSPDGRLLAVAFGETTYVAVFDVASAEVLWTSPFQQAHFWEHVDLRWDAHSRLLWWAWDCGSNLSNVDLSTGYMVRSLGGGRSPRFGGELAVSAGSAGVKACDRVTGRVLWTRVALSRDGAMFQTLDGYFDCDSEDLGQVTLDRLRLFQTSNSTSLRMHKTPLVELATTLFDPKRVRAARAGVELAPIAW